MREAVSLGMLALALSALAVIGGAKKAIADASVLHKARRSLARYDLRGTKTLATLSELTRVVTEAGPAPAAGEARYLRAVAASDLVIAARVTVSEDLEQRLATALGIPPQKLVPQLLDELQIAAQGVYRDAALEAKSALELLSAKAADYATTRGLRRDLLLAHETARRGSNLKRLSALALDPCPDNGDCQAPFRGHAETVRRALASLGNAARALKRVQKAAGAGDPLGSALPTELRELEAKLGGVELRLYPAPQADIAAAAARARLAQPDLLVVVSHGRVSYGFAPKARLDDDGKVMLRGLGEPVLPRTQSLPIPADFKPWVVHIRPLVEALKQVVPSNELTIGLSATSDAKAHVLARVALSLRRVGYGQLWLTGRTDHGALAGVPVQLLWGTREAEKLPKTAMGLFVRLGGLSLRRAMAKRDIPRVRRDGRMHFDFETLSQRVGPKGPPSASVAFMPGVPAHALVASSFRIAPRRGELRLRTP